ncbi:MAG: CRISPR system precrRNA processing endoribonuclease RAMP protein Cas6 [Anaerolineae bacterium]|nr:CRISPR system precrRNA processing endoribonuclease RAMP protein Cas6 [Anaerolineae bacterium]
MIPITLLECDLLAEGWLDLGPNPGSSLRGALYEALAAMYDSGDEVRSRHDVDVNPVAWLLRLEDTETSGGRDVPRPLALRPPLQPAGDRLTLGLTFYGCGIDTAPMVISAVGAMGQIGMGRGRRRARLDAVRAVDPLTRQATLLMDAAGQAVAEIPAPPGKTAWEAIAAALAQDLLTVRFLTPTRIIREDRLCHQPVFVAWFQRLLERVRLLSEAYAEPVWVPFRELLDQARAVELVEDRTRWVEMWSHSRRDGTDKPTSGFRGEAVYRGNFRALLPWLLLGQATQVGKNTIKGAGWYEIVSAWRDE